MVINIKTKHWGNSVGVIIPKEIVGDLAITPGDVVTIEIQKKQNVLKELFGAIPFKRTTEEILKDVRKKLEGELI
ncbi:AbrB/MazE/SpoVT family DNA-binding domain-containing protein [Candidatus Woesearchaeota archaeon]|nr:AbrB/MazE/SpoVT family DNA-binding domain-containing protein [Candidatus Woesearchaeota archaeon]